MSREKYWWLYREADVVKCPVLSISSIVVVCFEIFKFSFVVVQEYRLCIMFSFIGPLLGYLYRIRGFGGTDAVQVVCMSYCSELCGASKQRSIPCHKVIRVHHLRQLDDFSSSRSETSLRNIVEPSRVHIKIEHASCKSRVEE